MRALGRADSVPTRARTLCHVTLWGASGFLCEGLRPKRNTGEVSGPPAGGSQTSPLVLSPLRPRTIRTESCKFQLTALRSRLLRSADSVLREFVSEPW